MTTVFGNAILLLDRYFLSVDALRKRNEKSEQPLDLITRAKKSCVAYEKAPAKTGGKGRPAKKEALIKLQTLFETKKDFFCSCKILMDGKKETVHYLLA